jgi:GT2 family glycosyltransferase
LVSVIIPCCGQLEFTRLCVPSVLRHSRSPYEVVFVDIESIDGTSEYLEGVAAAAPVRVEVVRTTLDSALQAGCKEAFARAKGEFVALLGNDTVVTEGWLDHLVTLAALKPEIGMVGPVSNYAPPAQLVETVPYRLAMKKPYPPLDNASSASVPLDLDPVDQFARQWRTQNRTQWMEVEQLAGFCVVVKREVLETIAPLGRRPDSLEFFDAEALSSRARQCGYRLACCRDLFIHHFGSRSMVSRPVGDAAGAPLAKPTMA